MIKKKWPIVLTVFFLAQSIISSSALSFESGSLNSPADSVVNYSASVLPESAIVDPIATFQISFLLNEILSGCSIKPYQTYSSSEVNRSL